MVVLPPARYLNPVVEIMIILSWMFCNILPGMFCYLKKIMYIKNVFRHPYCNTLKQKMKCEKYMKTKSAT